MVHTCTARELVQRESALNRRTCGEERPSPVLERVRHNQGEKDLKQSGDKPEISVQWGDCSYPTNKGVSNPFQETNPGRLILSWRC